MAKTNKTTTLARDSLVIAGITKDLKNASAMPIAGTTYTPVALITLIQSRINAINAAAAARAQWLDAVKAVNALNAQVDEAEAGLQSYVLNLFGKSSPLLADFGFAPKPRATPDLATRTLAAAKAAATRKARGTMGKKEKAKITGTVGTTVATQTATTPAPSSPSTPVSANAAAPSKS